MAVRIEAFDPGLHDTRDFRCGSDSQDNVLRRTAKRQQRDGYTRLYVAFLSHLAVDGRQQGKGLGRILLMDAMQQCQRAGQILAVRLMLLDVAGTAGAADRARLHSFSRRWGSGPCQDDRIDCSSL